MSLAAMAALMAFAKLTRWQAHRWSDARSIQPWRDDNTNWAYNRNICSDYVSVFIRLIILPPKWNTPGGV